MRHPGFFVDNTESGGETPGILGTKRCVVGRAPPNEAHRDTHSNEEVSRQSAVPTLATSEGLREDSGRVRGIPSRNGQEMPGRVSGCQGWGLARVPASRQAWSISGTGSPGPRPRSLLCAWACLHPMTSPLPMRLGQTGGPPGRGPRRAQVSAWRDCVSPHTGTVAALLPPGGGWARAPLGRGSAGRPDSHSVVLLQEGLDSWTGSYTRVARNSEGLRLCMAGDWGPGDQPSADAAFERECSQ